MTFRHRLWVALLWSLCAALPAHAPDDPEASDPEADGGARLYWQPGEAAVARQVDKIVRAVIQRRDQQKHLERLRQLGSAAVPRLVAYLQADDPDTQLVALSCLDICWSPQAREPVLDKLSDRRVRVRKLALLALLHGEPPEDLAPLLEDHLDSEYPEVAGTALQVVESVQPDLQRMQAAMSRRKLWPKMGKFLPRYYDESIHASAKRVFAGSRTELKLYALVALIHQQDDSPETREAVVRLLQHKDAAFRELAAEYFSWHGTDTERKALELAVMRDRDRYAHASMRAAMDAIDHRQHDFDRIPAGSAPSGQGSRPAGHSARTPADRYRQAGVRLRDAPVRSVRREALDVLRTAEPMEPYWRFGREPPDKAFLVRNQARMNLVRLCFAFGEMRDGRAPATQPEAAQMPPAETRMPPVRDYFDKKRKSFGKHHAIDDGPFSDSHHVGDDVAWDRPHATVVAVADGIVRSARVGRPSWGGLVIIEHVDPDGDRFCSLYGHLGPAVCVRAGQVVRKGEKIGSIGRTHTWENGGHRAHLHFAIHQGPYHAGAAGPAWITGYLAPTVFKRGRHGWVDPQAFLKQR